MALTKQQKKRLIVWIVFILFVMSVVIVLIVFLSKSFRENDLTTQEVSEGKPSPVSEAYFGIDKYLGKTIESFENNDKNKQIAKLTFPQKISEYTPEKAYLLTNITGNSYDYDKGAEEMQERAPKLFKAFFGDSFNEDGCTFRKLNDLGIYIDETYEGKNGENASYGVSGYSLISDQKLFEKFNDQSLATADNSGNSSSKLYFYKDDPDITIKLSDGEITIKQAGEMFEKLFNETLSDFTFGYKVKPYKAEVKPYNGGNFITITGEAFHDGIPFEGSLSNYYIKEGIKQTSYGQTFIEASMNSKEGFFFVTDSGASILAKSEPVDKILSFDSAVNILLNGLAKNSEYSFIDVKLMYSCKVTQNEIQIWDEDKEKLKKLNDENNSMSYINRPTWYFITREDATGTSGIKVDALSGEITIIQ